MTLTERQRKSNLGILDNKINEQTIPDISLITIFDCPNCNTHLEHEEEKVRMRCNYCKFTYQAFKPEKRGASYDYLDPYEGIGGPK